MVERGGSSTGSRRGRGDGGASAADVWRPSPEELLHTLKRRPTGPSVGRFRRHVRHRCRVRVQVTLIENGADGRSGREGTVMTCDVSVEGFSFLWDCFVHQGTTVQARFESLPRRPLLTGVVRHCTHVGGRQHRVGVEFLAPAPGGAP